ncbi:MAG: filamentous hemagglutinin N-terminal domain-containing protein [Phycisphaerales bacterium]|nr:filamentous hemagglutinin N-terminal domain-containing protein [Phycisphaerales bacterium]
MDHTTLRRFNRLSRPYAAFAAAFSLLIAPLVALGGPQGMQVINGNVVFKQNGNVYIIQASNKSIINFSSFNIGANETVQFIQPNELARVLNRITGPGPTQIDGQLLANGIVYLVNPAGVIFGNGSVVDVGGIYAAAADISNTRFIKDINRFPNVTGDVVNHGTIHGNIVHLIGKHVANHGVIVADGGLVSMLAGDDIFIGKQNGRILVRIDGHNLANAAAAGQSSPDVQATPGVENTGIIRAHDGQVVVGAGDLYSLAIRNSGTISAKRGDVTVAAADGVIHNTGLISASTHGGTAGSVTVRGPSVVNSGEISADSDKGQAGSVEVTSQNHTYLLDGSLVSAAGGNDSANGGEVLIHSYNGLTVFEDGAVVDVSGGYQGGHGGFAEVSGKWLDYAGHVNLKAKGGYDRGHLLIDPRDITIELLDDEADPAGSKYLDPEGSILFDEPDETTDIVVSVHALTQVMGEITLQATRDIFINDDVNLVNSNDVTLEAWRDIFFNAAINGAHDLTATADADNDGDGALHLPIDFDLSGSGNFSGAEIRLSADISAGVEALVGGGGDLTFNDPVILTEDVTLNADNITFASTIDSDAIGTPRVLQVNSANAGTTIFGGAIGSTALLEALTTNADGETQLNGGAVTANADLNFNDPVRLGADTTLAANDVTFAQTVDSFDATDRFLVVNTTGGGATTFADAVGSTFDLLSLTTNADGETRLFGGSVVTSADQTYNDAVRLGADTTLAGNDVTFASTVNSFDATDRFLVVNTTGGGITTFGGTVGSTFDLLSLTTNADGETRLNGGSIITSADQTYNDAVRLGANTTLTGNDITLASTMNSFDATDRSLVVNTSGGGITTFGGAVGASFDLLSLSTNTDGETRLNGGSIITSGDQTYNDSVWLGANTTLTANDITFVSTVNSLDATDRFLVVNTTGGGITTFGGAIGSIFDLLSLTTNADGETRLNGGSVITSADQTYNDALRLGANTTLAANDVTFAASVNSFDATDRFLTVNTTGGGVTTFGGAVGTSFDLLSLTTNADGETRLNGGSVITSADQTYNDALRLGANTTLTANNITFASTVNSFDATDRFLVANTTGGGITTFGGAVGTSFDLLSLTTNADGETRLNGGSIITSADQAYNDVVRLGANATLAANDVTFAQTVDSLDSTDRSLVVNTTGGGITTFASAVGSIFELLNLTTNSDGETRLNGGVVITSADQTFNDAVRLGADTTLTGNDITLGSTVNSFDATDRFLVVNTTGGGITTFGGAVGATFDLSSLTTNSDGETRLNGGSVMTSGDQSYDDAVRLGANTTLTANDITFASTVDSFNATDRFLVVNTTGGGNTTFNGDVGTDFALMSLTTNADGQTNIAQDIETTNGITFADNVVLTGAGLQTLDAGAGLLHAQSTVDKDTGNLDLVGGSVELDDNIVVDIGSLEVTGALTASGLVQAGQNIDTNDTAVFMGDVIGGGNVTFDDATEFNGLVDQTVTAQTGTLWAKQTVTKNNGGNLALNGELLVNLDGTVDVNDGGNLAITGDGGDLVVAGTIDAEANLLAGGDITVDGAATVGGNVNAGGNVTFHDASEVGGFVQATGGNALFEGEANIDGNITAGNNATFQQDAFLGGDVFASVNITFEMDAEFDGSSHQSVDADGGLLDFNGSLVKSSAGNLSLHGDTGIHVAGNAQTGDGNLVFEDDVEFDGAAGVNQVAQAGTGVGDGMLDFHGSTLRTQQGNLNLVGADGIEVAGNATTFDGDLVFDGDVEFDASAGSDQLAQAGDDGTLDFQGDIDRTEDGNLTLIGAGGIEVAGNASTSNGDLFLNNDTEFDGAGDQEVLANGGTLDFDGEVEKTTGGALTLAGTDGIFASENVETADGDLTFADDAHFDGEGKQEISASGGLLSFASDVEKLNGGIAGNLKLIGDLGVSIGGDVEVQDASLIVQGDAFLGGDVFASVNVHFRDDIEIQANGLKINAGESVRLLGQITSEANETNDLRIKSLDGDVVLGGSIGTNAANQLGTLRINAGGDGIIDFRSGHVLVAGDLVLNKNQHASVPLAATIVGRDDLSINVGGDFIMGQNEKFTVLGDLAIHADNATLSDLSTLGDMTVDTTSAGTILILRRLASNVLEADGSLVEDLGVDFVAGGEINFIFGTLAPQSAGDPRPTFATVEGINGVNLELAFALDPSDGNRYSFRRLSNVYGSFFNGTDSPVFGGSVLDLRTQGPTETDPSTALASTVPLESRVRIVPPGAELSAAQREHLAQLRIRVRNWPDQGRWVEETSLAAGKYVFEDVPSKVGSADREIAEGRLDRELVTRVLAMRDAFLETTDPEQADKKGWIVVKEMLQRTWTKYYEEMTAAGVEEPPIDGFRAYIEGLPETDAAPRMVADLRKFLEALSLLGLNSWEAANPRSAIIHEITPADMQQVIEKLFEQGPDTRTQAMAD